MKTKHYFLWVTSLLITSVVLLGCQNKRGSRKMRQAAINKKNTAAYVPKPPPPPKPKPQPRPPIGTGPLGKSNSYRAITTGSPVVALTFDDGPHATNTPRLLDILKARNVRATFYVTGQNARKYPSILRRMIAEGHEIGNHTLTHGRITSMSPTQVRSEINACHQAVKSATGITPRSFRPPYGATSDSLKSWIKSEYGMPSILWSVDPEDWKKPGVSVVTSRLVNGAKPGGILLLHDIHSASIDATPGTLDQLKARGYRFVTVSHLISMEQ